MGGGGADRYRVENPPAKELVPEDKPGIGPGTGGGAGKDAGTGAGYVAGAGIGTRPDGVAPGTLRAKPGDVIGAGVGSGIGTRSPGGGRGTGEELPGTGGSGKDTAAEAGSDLEAARALAQETAAGASRPKPGNSLAISPVC